MGVCVSKQQIVKTVASPQRPPSTKSKAPTSPPKFPPDARLTTAVDLPGTAKDDDHHPFFPHEAVTPEVFSARNSTDGENSITEEDTQASAVCQTSKEPATFKSSEASMQPGSLPDKFHDASDMFENSLDFPPLNSENNPLHEIGSEKDRIRPPTCTSFTHRETMKEKPIEKNKQEPPQTVVTLQRIREISSAEETNSEAAEHDHLIQHEAEESAKVSTLLVKHSDASVKSIVESNTMTEQESRMVTGKETLQVKEKGLAEPELTTDNSNKEDPKIYESSTDSGTSETPVKTANAKLVEQPALVEEKLKETDTDPTARKDAKIVEQTASVKEWQKGSEIAATIVAATVEILAVRDSEKSLDRSASSIEKQHKELETDIAMNATTETNQTLATIDFAQTAPTEAAEKGSQSEQPSSNEETSTSLKLQITEAASSLDNEACQETRDDSHTAIKQIEPKSQKQDMHNDQSKENQEGQASVVPEQAADVKQMIDSKDLCETKGDSSQAASQKDQLEFQRQDQGKGIPEKAPSTNNSGKLDLNLNELSTNSEISKILVPGNDLNAVDQTASIETRQGEPDTAGLSPADEPDQAETLATREYVKTVKQMASIEEHQEELEPAGATSNKAAEPTQALPMRTNVQNLQQPMPLEEKHQVLEAIPATNMTIETVEPLTSWNDAEKVETDPATNVAIETAETPVTRHNSEIADTIAPLEELCEESEKDPTINSTIKTIGSLAINNDAQSADPTAAKEEWLEEVDVAPATNAATESAETLTTRGNAQISNPIVASQEQQKQSDTSITAYATTTVSVLGRNEVKENINVVDLESRNVENSKEPEYRDSTDQQSVSSPAFQEQHEKSDTAQASQGASATVGIFPSRFNAHIADLTVPSNEQHKQSETTPATDADIVLINTVADGLNIVGFEGGNDENVEEPECKDLGQQQRVLSPSLDEQHEKIDTDPATSATEEQQEESNTTPAVDATTEPDVAPSNTGIKDAQAVEPEHTNAGYIEKQESTYVNQQPAISSPDLKELQEEFDIVQTTSAATEIAEPLAAKDDAWIANQTVPSEEKHEESGTIPAATSTTEGNVVPIHRVTDITLPRKERHKESETTPDTDATTGTDVVVINTVAKGVNIVGLESSNDENIEEPESMDVDQQQTILFPSLDEQREKSDTAAASSANEEQQEESTMEPDVAPLDAITKDAQAVELESTNAGNVEKCKSTYIDQQQTVSSPALKEQFDIFQTTSTAAEIDEALATKDDAQIANPVVPSEEQHEESRTIPATDSTKEADVVPIKAVTDPIVPRNEQHKEPETTPATDATTDADILLTNKVAEGVNIVGLQSSNDENAEKPENTDVDQQQTSLFPSLDQQCEKSDAAPASSATEEQQEGSNKTLAIDATTVPDVAPIDGVTKDAQAVELQSTNAENAEKQESTYIDQQQAVLSPPLKELQEEFDTVQTTSTAAGIAEPFVTKYNAWIANPIVPSEEQHEESGTTPATASTTEADIVPINVVTDPTVPKNKQHKESEITSAIDATTDIDVVFINTVAEGANFGGPESIADENVEEPESTYVDQQQTLLSPYLDEQCENSDTAPATSASEEQQEESNTTPAIDAKTEPDVAPTDAVTKDTQAVEHESTNGENVEKHESTYIDQQQAVSSPALKEPQEQFGIVQTTSTAAEIAEPLATKKQIANPTVPSEEQHEESDTTPDTASRTEANVAAMNVVTDPTVPQNEQHNESKATPATDAMTDTDVVVTNTLAEGVNIVGLESSNDENIEKPGSMDVDQQQTTSSPSLDEQCEKSDTAPATSATEEQQEESNTTPAVDATTEPDVAPFDAVTKDNKAAELESTNAENVEKRESTYIDQQQAVLSPALKELREKFDIVQTASAAAEIAEALATKDDAWIANPTMPSEEQHAESGTTPATASTTEADVVPTSAVTDTTVARNDQHKESETTRATNATTDTAVVLISTVTQGVAIVGLGGCNDENVEEPESTDVGQQQTISSPSLDEQHERSDTAPATCPSEEQQEESNTIPAIDATTKANVTPVDATTRDAQTVELESTDVENVEKQESTYIDEQQAVSSPALKEPQEEFNIAQTTSRAAEIAGALATKDDACIANPTVLSEEQYAESGTTPACTITKTDVVPINAVTENVKVVELERGSAENVEQPESAVVDKKQSVSFPALEEQCKESGMAPAANRATEITEILPTGSYAQIAELIQPMEEWQEHSDTTPVTDAITEADNAPIGVETEVVKAVELESSYAQNVEEPESTNDHLVQTVLSPAIEKQQLHSDTTPVIDAITEADDVPIHTVTEELKATGLGSSNAEVEELKCTDGNLDLTVLCTALEEQHKESDIPQASDAAAENVGIIPSRSDASMADATLSTEVQHEESDTSPATNTTREADAAPNDVTIEDAKFAKLKSSNIEYTGKSKSVDIEQQPKVPLTALEEQLKESDTTPATSAATEIAETFPTRDAAQMVDPIIPTEELYEEPISNQVTNATTETNIDIVTEDAQVVELQSNNPENVEDPESSDVDQKQRASSLTLEEKREESETAKATDAAKIVAEILPTQNDVQIPDPKVPTEEQQKESNTTPTIDTTIKADDALTKNVKAVEIESGTAANAEPKSAGNEQQTASSPVFDEQHEKTDTTPASDAMIETDVPVDPVTKDVNVVELESTNAKNEEESGNAHIDQCQKFFPPNLEEQHQKSCMAPTTSATSKIAKDLPTSDDVGMADPTVPTEEQHKELETTSATDATTGIGNVVVDTVILDGQVVELKFGNAENVEGPGSADFDKKLAPTLEEQSKETGTDPAINAAAKIANTLPTRDNQQKVDPTVSTTEQYEASAIIPAPDPPTAAVVVPVNTVTEDVNVVEHENSHTENVKEPENAGIDQQQAISSAALELQHKESVTDTGTCTPTKTARTLPPTDNTQRADPTVQIEGDHESDATPATDAPTAIAEVAKLVEPESYNPENVEQPESTDNNQQQAVSRPELEEQHESHTSPAANAGTEIAEMLPVPTSAQIADPTVSAKELHEELNSNQVANAMIETNIDAKPEDTQLMELQSNHSENVEDMESADTEHEHSVSSLALKEKHEELETAQVTNAANEIVEILPMRNEAQRANPTEEQQQESKEQQEESDTTPTAGATTEVDGISYNVVTQDVKIVEHESSNVENAEGTKYPDTNQQQTILSPVLEEQHEKSGTTPSAYATMKTQLPINPITEDVKVEELESSNAGNKEEPESTDIGQHKVISPPNLDEWHKESDTGLTSSATRESVKMLPRRSNVQMPDPAVPTEEQHKELDATPPTDATTATDDVAIDTIIQEACLVEFKTSNAENVRGPDTAGTHKKQLVSSPTLEVQGEELGTDPAINAPTEIANTLPTRDDEQIADPTVSATEQYEELNTIPAPNATAETDLVPVNTVTEDVKIVKHESSNTENVKEPNTDQQQVVASPTLEPQDKESVIVPATYAKTETDKTLPTMGNAQRTDPTVPIQNHHEESDTAPATNATTEEDVVCINAITQVLEVLEVESGNAENVEQAESADLKNQEQTVSSPALEEQHEESHTSPAADAATEITEMLPMRNNAQTAGTRVSTDRLYEESNSNKGTNTTTEADIDAVTADTQVVELEGNNYENVEDQMRVDTDKKHLVSCPALEEKHEESEAAQTANTAKEIFEILPTRNDAQIEDPTLPSEEQQKEPETTPAVDATVKADDITDNAVTLDVKVAEIESSNADNAEDPKSTHIDQQQAFSTLAFGKQHEESEATPTVDATTETHIPISPVTEDINVVELEDKANTVGEKQSTDIDQHQTVSPPALDEHHEESDTAPTTSAVTKIIKTPPTRSDAQIADSTGEQQEEFDTTSASNAITESDNVAIDTVKQISKFAELKSSNAENAEGPESADMDKKQSVLCPTLEGQGEGSHTDPANNAATGIVNTLPARDAQQIADSKVSITEQHEESNTIPAPDATTEVDNVPINAVTEDIKVVELECSKAENVESEIADLTIPTEEHYGESDITLAIDATTEGDVVPKNAGTEVQNAEIADPTVPTQEYNGESETTPAIDATKEGDAVAIDAVTEVIKAVELDSGNVENAEEPEITGIKQQQVVSYLPVEEQHEELLMSPAASAATEIAEILPTEDYAQKADPTVLAGTHEESDTTQAADATTGVDVLSISEMTEDVKIVELESNIKNNEQQSKDSNEQQTVFSLALEEPHDELNPTAATNADTEIIESKSIDIAQQQQTVSSRAFEQNLEESDMALATNAATGIAKTPLPMDDTYATDTTVPDEEQHEEPDTTPAPDRREVDVPPSSTIIEITKVWQVKRRDAENVEESAHTGQQQAVWSPALEEFEKSNTTPATNVAIETAEPLLRRDNEQRPVPTEERHEQSDATQATNATDVDVPAISPIKEDVKAVELQSSNAGHIEEPDSTEPNQQVVLPPASEEQQEGSDIAPAINASTEIAEILHTRDNAKPVEPTIASGRLYKESDTTVSPNATIDINADVHAVNALTKGMKFLGLKSSNSENTGDQESMGNEKQVASYPPLDACGEEKEFEHKKCEASSEVSLNEACAIAELQHNVIKGADAEINAMGIPEITDHNIANGEKEGIAAQGTKEVDHGTAKTFDSSPTKEETKAGWSHPEEVHTASDATMRPVNIPFQPQMHASVTQCLLYANHSSEQATQTLFLLKVVSRRTRMTIIVHFALLYI